MTSARNNISALGAIFWGGIVMRAVVMAGFPPEMNLRGIKSGNNPPDEL
jgi:hypothetical protein